MKKSETGWQIKSLEEVSEFLDSQRIPIKDEERTKRKGIIPYYGANGQVGWIDDFIFDEPLVLLAEDGGYFGSKEKPIAYKISGKSWVNNHAHVLRAKSNCDVDYLHRVLSYYDLSMVLTGTTRQKLRKGDALKISIPLPPLPIQKQIAEILEKADHAKQKRKEANKLTEQFLQSAFIEMFGDPVKNPMGWKVKKGDQLFDFTSGKFNPTSNLDDSFMYPTYGGNGITGYSKNFLIEEKTIVIGRVGAYCGCVHLTDGKVWITDNAIYIKRNKENINLSFLYFLLVQMKLNSYANYSGQPKITQEPLKELNLISPPLSLQQQFAELVQKTETLKEKQKASEKELENLFNSLMQKAFKGELEFADF